LSFADTGKIPAAVGVESAFRLAADDPTLQTGQHPTKKWTNNFSQDETLQIVSGAEA